MNTERYYKILLEPRFTEKTTQAGHDSNQVVFKVAPSASKDEIARAVEHIFEVSVKKVNVVNIKGKVGRNNNGTYRRASVRKAYVTLDADAAINFSKY